ncbi:3-keto-L-gulonate-6-phosphate decarboxylase UlaD [Fructobacillus ficulneus]|uniref:3-hexulose-6-phosphate synthase n=1 Tax=Fructobacillus ficulneus TaxID=157463 RepID=A0A0K8MI84_9LACO|nr:3-keto-L-gulonate-6-phosphate decarboxylase UlaD [Fructobacillus ficulneus]GAP00277.1 3-keto-L-gulonate-6-phosphate decarboxylase [Fructobacillus ficulneus]
MTKPKLQIALDQNSLAEAVAIAHKAGPIVDIVEVGTILALQAGQTAIETLSTMFPNKIIVADAKCADAGKTVAQNAKHAGADYLTVIDSATLATMLAAKAVMPNIQVELYSAWTYDLARQWIKNGIDQVIYHQSRDALLAGETWGNRDLTVVENLIDMGFRVSVTGGLTVETIPLFAGLPIETMIAGRAITGQNNPGKVAEEFQTVLTQEWG